MKLIDKHDTDRGILLVLLESSHRDSSMHTTSTLTVGRGCGMLRVYGVWMSYRACLQCTPPRMIQRPASSKISISSGFVQSPRSPPRRRSEDTEDKTRHGHKPSKQPNERRWMHALTDSKQHMHMSVGDRRYGGYTRIPRLDLSTDLEILTCHSYLVHITIMPLLATP